MTARCSVTRTSYDPSLAVSVAAEAGAAKVAAEVERAHREVLEREHATLTAELAQVRQALRVLERLSCPRGNDCPVFGCGRYPKGS